MAPGDRAPHHVVDDIIAKRDLTGERKFVTVLFADIKGSTEVTHVLDPDDCFLVLERFHELATSSIHRFDGIVALVAGNRVEAAQLAEEAGAIAWVRGNDNYELIALLVQAPCSLPTPGATAQRSRKIASRCEHLMTTNQMDGYRR